MTETELKTLLSGITPPDEAARAAAHAHWAGLAKPLGGLGALETLLEDAAALTGSAALDVSRRAVLVLCSDNGVVAQGVSQTDQSVTRAVAENLAARRTSVCQMARTAHCDVVPVDMGMAGDPVPGVADCRIAAGTADFTQGPAMTRAQAVEAVGRGIRLVQEQKAAGVQLLATGEMGIGNTTTSSAVAAVLLGQPVERMTGRGAGLSDEGLARKVDAICRGILRNEPDPTDPLDVLAKLGGFDLAGLCGVFLGGALEGVPVVMDGFISGVAALCAVRLCPAAAKAVFASHCSSEPAARLVLDALGKAPLLTAGLHLGEGTGAVARPPAVGQWHWAVYDHWLFLCGGRHHAVHPRNADAGASAGRPAEKANTPRVWYCAALCRAIIWPPCRCGTPNVPPGWKSTAECGRQNSLKRWSAPCIWTPCICPPVVPRCWKIWAT